jgi:hypothetical protein
MTSYSYFDLVAVVVYFTCVAWLFDVQTVLRLMQSRFSFSYFTTILSPHPLLILLLKALITHNTMVHQKLAATRIKKWPTLLTLVPL